MKKRVQALNLSLMFNPVTLLGIQYEKFIFSGGEVHIKLNNKIDYSIIDKVIITCRVKNASDLMSILFAKDALERKGIKEFSLIMPYVPYARQDRKCFDGESFTLKIFANILNSANFDEIHIFDAHSDVAPALINNCINNNNHHFVAMARDKILGANKTIDDIILISPDSGANKKINKLSTDILFRNVVKCDKQRDVSTGNISGFEVFSDDLQDKDCLIVDDICDGGGTFIGLAKELKNKNCGELYLFVTHGIFSKGFDNGLNDYFERIFITNSFSGQRNEKVTEFKIEL